MEILIRLLERDNYVIKVDGRRLIAHKDAVADIVERLIYDNVVDSITIRIKDCEECKLEALEILTR